MIIVTGSVLARPDTLDDVLRLSLEHVRRSRLEPGCVSHNVFCDVENPQRVFFFEQWADRSALDTHFGVPASLDFVNAVGPLSDKAPTLDIFDTAPPAR